MSFYAAINSYASSTSIGFSDAWGYLAFDTKKLRDAYVANATDIATKAIRSTECKKYGGYAGKYDVNGVFTDYLGYHYRGKNIDPTTGKPLGTICRAQ